MDRRTFVMTGARLAALDGALPWIADAASARGALAVPAALAVVDSTLAQGRAFADCAARMNLPCFEAGDDIGALWYATLAPRLMRAPGWLLGVTRRSDFFVLGQLATHSGRMVTHASDAPREGPFAPVAFLLGPAALHATTR